MKEKILAIIPARGGSKGVPHKNIKLLLGKPLIAYTIEFLINMQLFDEVVVSTDDLAISEVAIEFGASVVLRPKNISQDDSQVFDAVQFTLFELKKNDKEFHSIYLFEPTCPIRNSEDVLKAVDIMRNNDYDSIATFSENHVSPYRLWNIDLKKVQVFPFFNEVNPFLPRQNLPKAYFLNGFLYGIKNSSFNLDNPAKSMLIGNIYPMLIRDPFIVDIDSENDFIYAEYIILKKDKL